MEGVGLTVLIFGGVVFGVAAASTCINCIKNSEYVHAIFDTILEDA